MESTDTAPAFKPGDKVSFTLLTIKGLKIRMSTKHGTLHSIQGINAIIKMRNGTQQEAFASSLRAAGKPDAITEGILKFAMVINGQASDSATPQAVEPAAAVKEKKCRHCYGQGGRYTGDPCHHTEGWEPCPHCS